MKFIGQITTIAFILLIFGGLLIFVEDGKSGNDFVYAERDIYVVVDHEANVCSSKKVDTIYQVELTQHVKDHHLPGVSDPPAPHDDGHGMTIWITKITPHIKAVPQCEGDGNDDDGNNGDGNDNGDDDTSGNNDG